MAKPQIAIVLSEEWVDLRDGFGQPIWPEELTKALDEIEGEHSEFEVCGVSKDHATNSLAKSISDCISEYQGILYFISLALQVLVVDIR